MVSAALQPQPEPLPEAHAAILDAYVLHAGDLVAICKEHDLKPTDILRWAKSPQVQAELQLLLALTKHASFLDASRALRTAIAELERQLARPPTDQDNPERRKCASMLARISIAQAPDHRHTQTPGSLPQRIHTGPTLNLFDRCDELRVNGAGAPHSLRAEPSLTPHGNPTSPERSDGTTAATNSSPSSPSPHASCPDTSMPSSMSDHSAIQSPHSEITPCLRGSVPSCLPQSAIQSPHSEITPCLRGSVPSCLPRSEIPPPAFGLSPTQLALYSPREQRRLVHIPCSDGTLTIFDPQRPFAGFNGDAVDFLRMTEPPLPLLDGESEYDFVPYIRPLPDFPVDFALPGLDDTDPFPTLDPEWFPKPVPGVTLPDNLKDLADLRLSPDISLTIARARNPWLCLPLTGKGKPDRKRICADTNARYAFRKVERAIFDARNHARSAWSARWHTAELWRLIALKRAGLLPPLPPERSLHTEGDEPPDPPADPNPKPPA